MDDSPVIYGLEDYQARALVAQAAETEKICFLVGTQSLRLANQVQLIEFDDDSGIVTKQAFDHSVGEIWRIASAPQTPDLIATVYNSVEDHQSECGAAIWRLPIKEHSSPAQQEEVRGATVNLVCELKAGGRAPLQSVGAQVWSVVWAPEDDSKLITLADNRLLLWDINEGDANVTGEASVEGRTSMSLGVGRWYPHQQCTQVAATYGCGVQAWDMRSMKCTWSVDNAHTQLVRDIDFNPNKQYYMATCGDDCYTHFWDIRNVNQPVLSRSDHSHWVWTVRFNPSYDQLVLSCSSDQRVVLSNLPSVASQPFGALQEESQEGSGQQTKPDIGEDGVIQVYDDHEDSVYNVEWSTADFWTFASVSYDGRLVINKVPKSVKYKQFL